MPTVRAPILVLLLATMPVAQRAHAVDTIPSSSVATTFPEGAEHRHNETRAIIGRIVSDSLVHESTDGWLAATVTRAPAMAMTLAGPQGILNRAKGSLLKDHRATETHWASTQRDGRAGRRLAFRTDDGREGISEIYTWDNVVVTVTALVAPGTRRAAVDSLFADLRLPSP